MGSKRFDDSRSVAGRLQHDLVCGLQAEGKARQRIVFEHDSPAGADLAVFKIRDLAEGARDIQSNDSHRQLLAWWVEHLSRGAAWATRQLRIRARSATGRVAGAASY